MRAIKVVCLNLWQGGTLFTGILEFLRQENPDILLLQEVYNSADPAVERQYHSMQTIQKILNFPFQNFAPALIDTFMAGKFESGNGIFSRFPITAQEIHPFGPSFGERAEQTPEQFKKTPRNLQLVTIKIGGTELNVGNFQGVWDLDGENDSPARLEMSRTIVQAVKDKPNVILAGDTNVRPNTKTIRAIETHLKNVFKDELTTTFNMRRKTNPGYATSVVDMLFASPTLNVAEHYCPDVDISDHLPLVATLEMGEGR